MSEQVNQYLEHRRSRLIANDTLMRSLGLLPAVQPSLADKANGTVSKKSDQTATPSSEPESANSNQEKKTRKRREAVIQEASTTTVRRSPRAPCPRQRLFMQEDFTKQAKMAARKNGSVKVAEFPYNGNTTESNSGENSQEDASNVTNPQQFEKGSLVAVVWEAFEPQARRVQEVILSPDSESDDDDDEEEEGEAEEDGGDEGRGKKNDSGVRDDDSESESESGSEKANHRSKRVKAIRTKRFYLDLPHEKDFYATLVMSASKENQHIYDIADSLSTAIPAHSVGTNKCEGVLKWLVPSWLPLGMYKLQIGSSKRKIFCETEEFSIFEAVGSFDETNVGVWCVCGNTDARQDYTGSWVSCTACASWQHWSCYTRISESRKKTTNGHQPSGNVLERVIVEDEDETEASSSASNGDNSNGALSALEISQKRRKLSKKERQEITEALAARVSHAHLLVPDVLPNPDEDFLCWACQPLACLGNRSSSADDKRSHNQALGERCELMINMIGAASGGYSRKTLAGGQDSSQTILCNTPNHVVKFLRTLIDFDNEKVCADLGAGTGSFSGALPPGSLCVEINEKRYNKGKMLKPEMQWLNEDALNADFFRDRFGKFDLVISNPDFEVGLQFIFLGLCMIRNACLASRTESMDPDKTKSGRLVLLLPSDFFEASNLRARIFKLLDFHIETEYKLGHLCYYEDQPQSQKLTCDSLFVLRPGRSGVKKYEHRVINARLAGML